MASTTAQNYEQTTYRGGLSQQRGAARELIGDAVATRQLLADESGALCQLDVASGVTYTLPALTAALIGMQFEFATTVTVTSNSHKVVTADTSTFLVGQVQMITAGSATTLAAAANGTTHRSLTSNGTTTGGVIGDRFRVTAISATQWLIDGVVAGTGTLATPFATS
jgi:hypothetical protein